MKIEENINQAEEILKERVKGFEGVLGTLDAVLTNFGDYSITLSCIALLNPKIYIDNNVPMAKFPGSENELPLDCFHVDLLHHSDAYGANPIVYKAIGLSLADSWNRILKESNISGKFTYCEDNVYDIIFNT